MNIQIVIVKMKGLLSKYEKITPMSEDGNDYANFRFAYINYYKPFQLYILKDLKNALKLHQEPLEKYREHILDMFYDLIKEEIYRSEHKDSEFIEKLSESIYEDFNLKLVNYKRLNGVAKKSLMNQFVFNKSKALLLILEKNPYLFLKTVSKIKSPLMQFYIINKLPEVKNILPKLFMSFSTVKLQTVLIEYFFYPLDIEPKDYHNLWEGQELIHVKFSKNILSDRYKESKVFLKMKYLFEREYLGK